MRKNHIAEVAKILGVKLNEIFPVKNDVDNKVEWFRFTVAGMEHFIASFDGPYKINGHRGDFIRTDTYLESLILGNIWIEDQAEQGALFP